MAVVLVEIDDANIDAVLSVRLAPGQGRFVTTVQQSLDEAVAWSRANPWYRAVYVDGEPVGFVMLSWNVEPQPPDIVGPWFLWKLIIDASHQGLGYGAQVVGLVGDIVRREGGTELLTSYVEGPGGPAGFYARLGFEPTGEVDPDGEIIMRLPLTAEAPPTS
jgi:GNAT superfamily N-acetyltransferase